MKKLLAWAAFTALSLPLCAVEQKVGVVNFTSCITESKLGKQEQNAFETMRKQFVSLIEDTDQRLREMSEQLKNKDHLDGLDEEAIKAKEAEFAKLNEELSRYQQQYYQVMQQGQNKIVQTVVAGIQHAADQIAPTKGYNVIINKDACFFYSPSLDITSEVLKEMDKHFEIEEKKQTAATQTPKLEEKTQK